MQEIEKNSRILGEECLDEDSKEVKVHGKKIPRRGAFQEGDLG